VAAMPSSVASTASSATPAAAPVTAGASAADGDAAVMQSIKTVLGDADDYRKVFSQLQQGVRTGDKQAVAKLVAYPLDVKIDGKPRTIRNAQAFIQSWDGIITPDIARVIRDQKFSDLFVNQKGVMFGDGQVWLSGICRDVACTSSDVRIITIQK